MTSQPNGMDWNDHAISTLRTLWNDGHSTAEIGRRMSITKNAVVGKVHRLKLPARPSPIGKRPVSTASAPPQPSRRRSRSQSVTPMQEPACAPSCDTSPPAQQPAPRPFRFAVAGSCQWPHGEPGSAAFRPCNAPALCGRPFCEGHCRVAYARPARVLQPQPSPWNGKRRTHELMKFG